MAGFGDIESWYNPVRPHSILGCRAPMTYEAYMQAAMTETKPVSQQAVHHYGSIPMRKPGKGLLDG